MEKVQDYFKSFPHSKECFQTSDGFLFHTHNAALNHSRGLKDSEIKRHERFGLAAADEPTGTNEADLTATANADGKLVENANAVNGDAPQNSEPPKAEPKTKSTTKKTK